MGGMATREQEVPGVEGYVRVVIAQKKFDTSSPAWVKSIKKGKGICLVPQNYNKVVQHAEELSLPTTERSQEKLVAAIRQRLKH